MHNNLNEVEIPDEMPELTTIRREMMKLLSPDQLAVVATWIGMEASARDSEEVFQVGKLAFCYAELVRSQGGDSIDFSEDSK